MHKSGFLVIICIALMPFAANAQVKVFLPTNNNNSPLSAPSVEEDDAPITFKRSELVDPPKQAQPAAAPTTALRGAAKSFDDDGSAGMTKREFMQPMEDSFNELDTNHDGILSLEELDKSK